MNIFDYLFRVEIKCVYPGLYYKAEYICVCLIVSPSRINYWTDSAEML